MNTLGVSEYSIRKSKGVGRNRALLHRQRVEQQFDTEADEMKERIERRVRQNKEAQARERFVQDKLEALVMKFNFNKRSNRHD